MIFPAQQGKWQLDFMGCMGQTWTKRLLHAMRCVWLVHFAQLENTLKQRALYHQILFVRTVLLGPTEVPLGPV